MKSSLLVVIATLLSVAAFSQQNVGIGILNPNLLAILDIYSNSQGLLIPRMNTAQRAAILTPVPNGLLVFDTDSGCVLAFDSVAAAWKNLCSLTGGTREPPALQAHQEWTALLGQPVLMV